jgi:hypothetical protein
MQHYTSLGDNSSRNSPVFFEENLRCHKRDEEDTRDNEEGNHAPVTLSVMCTPLLKEKVDR